MKRQWKILVVDDEPVQRESIAVWLTEDGYTVDTVNFVSTGDDEFLSITGHVSGWLGAGVAEWVMERA